VATVSRRSRGRAAAADLGKDDADDAQLERAKKFHATKTIKEMVNARSTCAARCS
jgi:hypothetical protein